MKREDWKRIVDNHRDDDSHAICDACLIAPEMYDRLEQVEADLHFLKKMLGKRDE